MSKLITKTYNHNGQSIDVLFTETAFFNATIAANAFGKSVKDWLKTDSTKEYIEAVAKKESFRKDKLVIVVHGGEPKNQGTWIHNSIKDRFISWLERDCRNSICNDLYVLLFSTGIIKVGTSSNITNRIRQHSYEASKYGVTIMRQYTELNSAVTEK
jgi:hypothetical protein